MNSHTNNKFTDNDYLTAEFYIHFSNTLVPGEILAPWVLLYMTGIIFGLYKKGDDKDIENYRPILLLKLIL